MLDWLATQADTYAMPSGVAFLFCENLFCGMLAL